ncbi:MAG: cell wall-binding repeat-containing protein [Peptacetobacter hiranonis]|nr:cell wall-binding repeat-containing protein [Peptacetobacter hiranonis]
MKTPKHLATAMAVAMVATSVAPVMAAPTTSNEEIIGKNRTETAVKISQDGWKSAETVILVNDSAIPDALTATPLAYAKNAPILLTGKD